jgi:hypothetical protein
MLTQERDFVSRPRTPRKYSALSFLEMSDLFLYDHQAAVINQQLPPRGRAGNPSLSLNSILMRPQSPSWLPRMFIDNSPAALRRFLSPVSVSKCTGYCQKMKPEEEEAAHVVRIIWSWLIYLPTLSLGFTVSVP